MGETKQEKYSRISKEIVEYVGGMDNIQELHIALQD